MKIKILLFSAVAIIFVGFLLGQTHTGCFDPPAGYYKAVIPNLDNCKPKILYKAVFSFYPATVLIISVGYFAYVGEGKRSSVFLIVMLGALILFAVLFFLFYLSAKNTIGG